MRAYAEKYEEDEELWAATGILHDLDYERHPDLESGHPRVAPALFDAKALFAVDELTGFIAAVALVRPTRLEGLTPKSVKKKIGKPAGSGSRAYCAGALTVLPCPQPGRPSLWQVQKIDFATGPLSPVQPTARTLKTCLPRPTR